MAAHARFADLVIVGQADPDNPPTATPSDLAEDVAMASARPVLIVPHIGVGKAAGQDGDAVLERRPRSRAGGDRRRCRCSRPRTR